MKFSIKDRKYHKEMWHKWFAWHPITLKRRSGKISMLWLGTVMRKGEEWHTMSARGWSYEYKEFGGK